MNINKKILSSLMLIFLLTSVVSSVTMIFSVEAVAFGDGSVDWWPMFRHDGNHTGYSESNVSTSIISLNNLTTYDKVSSSPAVVDGFIFACSLGGYVYRWNITAGTRTNSSRMGAIYSSPTVVGGAVYVGSNDTRVYALDETNLANIIKFYNTTGAVKSSPAVSGGVVYAGSSDGYFYAWGQSNGTELWRFWTASSIESSPIAINDTIVFGANDGRVYALEKSGRVKWYFQTNGSVVSSPAIADGIVFVGSNDKKVYAIDAETGKEKWNYSTNGSVISSPAIAFGKVLVGSSDKQIYALNITGEFVWNYTTGGAVSSSPAVSADGKVFVGSCDNQIYGLDISSGAKIWNATTGGPVTSSPAIVDGKVIVGSDDAMVHVFGPENQPPVPAMNITPANPAIYQTVTFDASASLDPDGNITDYYWDFGDNNNGSNKITTHVYAMARTYIVNLTVVDNGGTNSSIFQSVTVLEAWPMFRHDPTHWGNSTSFAPVTNGTLWNQTIGSPPSDDLIASSPAIINGKVIVGSANGSLYALDSSNGSVIWSQSVGQPIYSSPAVVDNMIFIALQNGTISGWLVNGTFLWSNRTGGPIYSSPAVSGNRVYVGSMDSSLYAFDKFTGNQLWSVYLGGSIDSSPAVAFGRVFVGSWNESVYAINETDRYVWSYRIGAQIRASPCVADGKVFIGAVNGKLYALDRNLNHLWNRTLGSTVDSSPAVAYGKVFVGSDDHVYALNAAANGTTLWNTTIGPISWSSPSVADHKIFIGSTNGKIYALNEDNGSVLWSYQTNGSITSSPAVLDDTVYVNSKDGRLYAFQEPVHNIAVANISSKPSVPQSQTAYINATLKNLGTYNETGINVTAQYDGSLFYNALFALNRSTDLPLSIPWTANVSIGTYTIRVNATLALPAIDRDILDNSGTCQIEVQMTSHNVGITGVVPSTPEADSIIPIPFKSVIGQGYNVTVYVQVKNKGDFNETNLAVTVYWSNDTFGDQSIGIAAIQKLVVNETQTIKIAWNTTGISYGNYTLSAVVDTVSGETDTTDNTYNCSIPVHVGVPGDCSGPTQDVLDRVTNMRDINYMNGIFNTNPRLKNWKANADVNNDGIVNMRDINIAIQNFNKHE